MTPGTATQTAAAARTAKPRKRNLTSFKLVPSPQVPNGHAISIKRYDSGLSAVQSVNAVDRIVHRTFAALPRRVLIFPRLWHNYFLGPGSVLGNPAVRTQIRSISAVTHPPHSLSDHREHCAHGVTRLPRRLARVLIWLYRHTLSALVGYNCRHLPTCSVYADDAIDRFGLWAGGWMTLARLLRCQPWGTSGIDNVPQSLASGARWYLPWRFGRWRGVNAP